MERPTDKARRAPLVRNVRHSSLKQESPHVCTLNRTQSSTVQIWKLMLDLEALRHHEAARASAACKRPGNRCGVPVCVARASGRICSLALLGLANRCMASGADLGDRRIRQELVPDDVTTGDERQTASATAKSEETCSQTKAGQAFLNNFRFCVHGPEEPSPSPKSYRESLQSLQAALRCNRLADQGRHQGSEGQDRAFRPAAQTQNCPES